MTTNEQIEALKAELEKHEPYTEQRAAIYAEIQRLRGPREPSNNDWLFDADADRAERRARHHDRKTLKG